MGIALVVLVSILLLCASVQADTIKKQSGKNMGTLTLYDGDSKEILYQYLGNIEVLNDGANGDNIEIVIHVPDTGCSCFDENGILLE